MAIPYVGKCFPTFETFLAYLDGIQFGAWRPSYVVDHHTGSPNLALWREWQTRKTPVTDEQWLKNLAEYYGKSASQGGPGDGPWQHGPHFMFTPKNFGVLSLPTVRGTHAKSFNANSWCVEMVGDFDSEPFDGAVRDHYVNGLAALHIATGIQLLPFVRGRSGLHFHRDDPLTSKTCPGRHVDKPDLINRIQARIDAYSGHGDHPSDITEHLVPAPAHKTGTVNTDGLSVRAGAGAKNPVLRELKKGVKVTVLGSAVNGTTPWINIAQGEWVAARFVTIDA